MELFGELAVRESGRPVLLPGEVEVRVSTLLSRHRVGGTLAQSVPSIVPADLSSRIHSAAHGADHQPVRPGQKGARGRQHHRDVAPHSVGGPGAHVPSIVPFLRALRCPSRNIHERWLHVWGACVWEAGGCIGIQEGYLQVAKGCQQVAEGCKWELERCTQERMRVYKERNVAQRYKVEICARVHRNIYVRVYVYTFKCWRKGAQGYICTCICVYMQVYIWSALRISAHLRPWRALMPSDVASLCCGGLSIIRKWTTHFKLPFTK